MEALDSSGSHGQKKVVNHLQRRIESAAS